MSIVVIPIPTFLYGILSRLPKWRETLLSEGGSVVAHAHKYTAVYFTFGIDTLTTSTGSRRLPAAAMVIVPKGKTHGWSILKPHVTQALVGHYHPGHAAHAVQH